MVKREILANDVYLSQRITKTKENLSRITWPFRILFFFLLNGSLVLSLPVHFICSHLLSWHPEIR